METNRLVGLIQEPVGDLEHLFTIRKRKAERGLENFGRDEHGHAVSHDGGNFVIGGCRF